MVLKREIPLLSHLAIRIRQSKTVCCACKNSSYYDKLKKLVKEGEEFQIMITPTGVEFRSPREEMPILVRKKSEKLASLIEQTQVDLSADSLITDPSKAQEASLCIGAKVFCI